MGFWKENQNSRILLPLVEKKIQYTVFFSQQDFSLFLLVNPNTECLFQVCFLHPVSNFILNKIEIFTISILKKKIEIFTISILGKSTVVFRCPIFCRQCFQIDLDLILPYSFISVILNKKAYF